MAVGHIAVRVHTRRAGHSAAAAVAYRCGLAITCERSGQRHDFTRRSRREDVAAFGLAGGRFPSPAAFAAAVESAETRRNSRIGRDVQIALPCELPERDRIALAEAFASELADRYGTAACWAVHRADRRGDARNTHAHIILPTRALAEDGCTFAKKLRQLDDLRRGPEEITAIRALWEARANEALRTAGLEARVYTGRTADPAPTLGSTHTAIERNAWRRRHPDQPYVPMSAEWLVLDDGVCETGRGRALARHAAVRSLKAELRTTSTTPIPTPIAAPDLPIVATVDPEPEALPRRPQTPGVGRVRAHPLAVVPETAPLPRRPPAPGIGQVQRIDVAAAPETDARPLPPRPPEIGRFRTPPLAAVPEPEGRPRRPTAPGLGRGRPSAAAPVASPEPEAPARWVGMARIHSLGELLKALLTARRRARRRPPRRRFDQGQGIGF